MFEHEGSAVKYQFEFQFVLEHVVGSGEVEVKLGNVWYFECEVAGEVVGFDCEGDVLKLYCVESETDLEPQLLDEFVGNVLLGGTVIKQSAEEFLMILEILGDQLDPSLLPSLPHLLNGLYFLPLLQLPPQKGPINSVYVTPPVLAYMG